MSEIALVQERILPMTPAAIEKVRALEDVLATLPDQVTCDTWHVLHGDMYARTIRIPAGVMLTGALIKVPTMLVINGDVTVYANDQEIRATGYHVVPASAGRKQAFMAHADTDLTMIFASLAGSVHEAEEEFTDEADRLMSRQEGSVNYVNITGE